MGYRLMETTATYPNRIKDKERVEKELGLQEFGNEEVMIYTKKDNIPIAKGYVRIVYGDHGPYIEFKKTQMNWKELNCKRADIGYYNIWATKDGVKIYDQRYHVKNLLNPPKGKYSVNNNCTEGYADYKIGMIYIDTDDIKLEISNENENEKE